MEAVCTLKRVHEPPDFQKCLICLEEKSDKLINGGTKGLETLKRVSLALDRLFDTENKSVIDRVQALSAAESNKLWWHKACFSSFTSKSRIERLQKKRQASDTHMHEAVTSNAILRSSLTSLNCDLCIFCQDAKVKGTMCSVTTLKMSENILALSKFDQKAHVRPAVVSYLIAAEGKNHPNCYKKFLRFTSQTKERAQKTNLAMEWLISDIKEIANKGHVIQLAEVWTRCCELAEKAGVEIPASFQSRRSIFKSKVQSYIRDSYDFITVPNQNVLLIPRQFHHVPLSHFLSEEEDTSTIPPYDPPDEGFLEMVHVALKLRGHIMAHPKYTGAVVSEAEMIPCVPESLFMFMRLMFGGLSLLTESPDEEGVDLERQEADTQTNNLSIAQDLVYNVTSGKHWTPKHVGLASTLHQATRSRELVQLFHNAGHIISYHSLLQIDTAMAEKTLEAMNPETGAVIPPNFVPGRFTHFTCDNIDINDSELDGKNTFHATQMARWQRGPEADMVMTHLNPSRNESLQVTAVMEELLQAGVIPEKACPKSSENTLKQWFINSDENGVVVKANAQDIAFFFKWQGYDEVKEGWTSFNKRHSDTSYAMTSIGYMPMVLAPAVDMDTLNTVVLRCKHVARTLGQNYVVITVGEALLCKLMELKWANADYQNSLVVRWESSANM